MELEFFCILQAITGMIRSTAQTIFAEYIGKFQIETIEFESLSLGNLPPLLYGKPNSSETIELKSKDHFKLVW